MWIKIHTKLLEWEWASCPETMALWLHILLRANYEDKKWQGIVIPRGSFVTSISALSSATGLTTKQVRTNMARLISTGEAASKSTNKYTIITVCKYDSYQVGEDDEGKQEGNQRANEGQTKGKQRATTADIKILKKEYLSKDKSSKESSNAVLSSLEDAFSNTVCGSKKNPIDLSFVDPSLVEIYQDFLDMRKKIGKPLKTQQGIETRYTHLMNLANQDTMLAARIAKQSIDHEWQDFYKLKTNDNGSSNNHSTNTGRSEADFSGRHYDTTLQD